MRLLPASLVNVYVEEHFTESPIENSIMSNVSEMITNVTEIVTNVIEPMTNSTEFSNDVEMTGPTNGSLIETSMIGSSLTTMSTIARDLPGLKEGGLYPIIGVTIFFIILLIACLRCCLKRRRRLRAALVGYQGEENVRSITWNRGTFDPTREILALPAPPPPPPPPPQRRESLDNLIEVTEECEDCEGACSSTSIRRMSPEHETVKRSLEAQLGVIFSNRSV